MNCRGDEETLANKEKLLELYKAHLTHSDTYIYLSAITGTIKRSIDWAVHIAVFYDIAKIVLIINWSDQ